MGQIPKLDLDESNVGLLQSEGIISTSLVNPKMSSLNPENKMGFNHDPTSTRTISIFPVVRKSSQEKLLGDLESVKNTRLNTESA